MEDLEVIPSARITPISQLADGVFVGGVHYASGEFVDFAKHRDWGGRTSHFGARDKDCSAAPKQAPDGLYGGAFFAHFGHFLTESLGRLWAAREPTFAHLPIYVHALWGRPTLDHSEGYHSLALQALGVDPSRIVIVEETITVRRLIVPRLLFWFDDVGVFDAKFIRFLANAGKFIETQICDPSKRPKKLYVSRAKWDAARGIAVGEPDFEAFLVEHDYVAMYPETLSFREQLISYSAAEKIIFAEGSAMHACVLLPGLKAKVASILRRASPVSISRQHYLGFTQEIFMISEVRKQPRFGMKDWSGVSYIDYEMVSRSLIDIGFLDAPFSRWPQARANAERVALEKFGTAAASYQEFDGQAFSAYVAQLPVG